LTPRAHKEARQTLLSRARKSQCIQSTRPLGRDINASNVAVELAKFQSTRPLGRDIVSRYFSSGVFSVSIHAPVRARPVVSFKTFELVVRVSIHAPVRARLL